MLAVRQIAALLVTTIAKWIAPLYDDSSEGFAKAFFWMLTSFNAVSIVLLVSPETLRRYVTTDMRGLNLLAVVGVWLFVSAFLFGRHSLSQLAAGARTRWPIIAGRENWITAVYCVLTVVAFVCVGVFVAHRG